jgi:hypothetical protein
MILDAEAHLDHDLVLDADNRTTSAMAGRAWGGWYIPRHLGQRVA